MSRLGTNQSTPQTQKNPWNNSNQSFALQGNNPSASGSGRIPQQQQQLSQHSRQQSTSGNLPGGAGPSGGGSSRKRKGFVRDGAEPWYLDPPGPDNRLTLALRSGLPSQIDWSLSRLIEASHRYSENIIFERYLGLSEALLSFPKRLCSALADEPKELWDEKYFELQEVENGMGIIVKDPKGQSREKRQRFEGEEAVEMQGSSKALNHFRGLGDLGNGMAALASSSRLSASIAVSNASSSSDSQEAKRFHQTTRKFGFDPCHIPSHARLLRRALEASLILRNCCTIPSNSKHLLSQGGMFSLTRSVLDLPDIAVGRLNSHSRNLAGMSSGSDYSSLELELESQQYLELEGLGEIRNYFLDMLEGIAPKMHLSKRANFAVGQDGEFINMPSIANTSVNGSGYSTSNVNNGVVDSQNGYSSLDLSSSIAPSLKKEKKSTVLRPQDSIFLRLLNCVHHSKDLALVLGSLRVLAVLAASERNEAAFVEMEMDFPSSSEKEKGTLGVEVSSSAEDSHTRVLSPGLVRRCVELLPVDNDAELQEANLDLLYQLVGIGNNAIKLSPNATSLAPPNSSGPSSSSLNQDPIIQSRLKEKASSVSHSVVRSLVRNLNHSITKWPREHQMTSHPKTSSFAPDPNSYRAKLEKSLQEARVSIEREGSALTSEEKRRLAALPEPQRCEAWLKETLESSNTGAVAQLSLVSSYGSTFQSAEARTVNTAPLLEGQQVMQAVLRLFPQTRAFQNPNNGQWLLRGIRTRVRKTEPYYCHWPTCHSPGTTNYDAVKGHILAHTSYATDGLCKWNACNFIVAGSENLSLSQVRELLTKHVLSHIPFDSSSLDDSEPDPDKKEGEEDQISKKTRTSGLSTQDQGHLPLVLSDGSRTLPLECDPFLSSESDTKTQSQVNDLKSYLKGSPTPNGTGTVDKPGKISCFVARTPMDSNELPIGIAGTSALILRSLSRISGQILDRSGKRPKVERINKIQVENSKKSHDAKTNKKIDYEDNTDPDLFGFPTLPPLEAEDQTANAFGEENGGASGSNSALGGIPEPWSVEAAGILMDAINSAEEDLVAVIGCNDVLCKPLNMALSEMRP